MLIRTVVAIVCILISTAVAREPSHDPEDIVRQVRHSMLRPQIADPRPLNPSLDDGEFLIDTNITYARAPGGQSDPKVASDGANSLVVWGDDRSGSNGIYGARVSPDGQVLDPAGFVVSAPGASPAVAFDGVNYLVVYRRYVPTAAVYGARVSPDGHVLDTAGFAISTAGTGWVRPLDVAFDGTNFLVVWPDYRGDSTEDDIYGARVTPSGQVLDSNGFVISRAAGYQLETTVAFNGTDFLVIWQDYRSSYAAAVYGARVTRDGRVLDTLGIAMSPVPGEQWYPAVASDSADFLVVWCSDTAIYGTRVNHAGQLLDSSGIVISGARGSQPSAAFNGTNFLVAWNDDRNGEFEDIYCARVNRSGQVLDSSGIAVSIAEDYEYHTAVGFNGSNLLVVWEGSAYNDICGARVTDAGQVLDSLGILISTAAYSQAYPSVTSSGTGFLAVWEDYRNNANTSICGARVSQAGQIQDPAGIVIAAVAGHFGSPAGASDGTDFLVVWTDARSGSYTGVYGARVTQAGQVLDSSAITISDTSYRHYCHEPAVSFDGANFLVVWTRNNDGYYDIYGARVSRSGQVLDTSGIPISTATEEQGSPALASCGDGSLVVWHDERSGSDYDIYGARVNRSGQVLDPSGIPICAADRDQMGPTVASDGANFLVAWGGWSIYGARVSPSGQVLDSSAIEISHANSDRTGPAAVFDGVDYQVVWNDKRDGSTSDIYGARVSPAGQVLDEIPVAAAEGNQLNPALARRGDKVLLVYQGWVRSAGGKTYNTVRIWGKLNPFAAIGEAPAGELPRISPVPTIVRGSLSLPASLLPTHYSLLSIAGRKVLALHPGANDVSRLAPGVYFVREQPQAASSKPQSVRKVLVTR